ncbi:MAG: tRNA lysidine(34) synthetase TilS, partial [Acidobacteria bacterium]|nr:tRNA lysidine(34) synthetase TilS [Acidobacteriota bacterium]
MDDLIRRVQAFADREGLWSAGDRVLAAVSGGADSVALAWILHHLARAKHAQLAGLVHLHHHIRGEAADADAAFVTALAERLGVPVHVGHADVPALARQARVSLEVAGRQARLAHFEDVRRAAEATVVAVAHTRSDQAETILLRLTRGAG